MGRLSKVQLFGLFLILVLIPALVIASPRAKQDQNKGAAPAQSAAQSNVDPANFVGAETCATCHEQVTKGFGHNPHGKDMKSHPGAGCESCHGPGKAHVEAGGDKNLIRNFEAVGSKEANETCLTCHSNDHAEFQGSQHQRNGVSCIGCHSVHNAKESKNLLQETEPQLCYSCHTSTKADFAKPFRHRVNERLMSCSDCHNPHGTPERMMLKSTSGLEQGCVRCHTDKAGPFVFEHAPVKADGCTSCHTAHGSANMRMLTRPTVNLVCLECHSTTTANVAAPTPAGPAHSQNARYQSCTVCHSKVHGSNTSPVFFR